LFLHHAAGGNTVHPVYLLAFATFALIIGLLFWNIASTKRNQKTGGNTSGIGGPNDPMA
jgi:hypothetical protein